MSFLKKVSNFLEQARTKVASNKDNIEVVKNVKQNHHDLLNQVKFKTNTEELSVVEMLMLIDKNKSPVQGIYFQSYWEYFYEIDAKQTFRNLLDQGYFDIESSLEDTLNKMTVPELKEILKSDGLKVTGKKAVLVERIIKEASLKIKRQIPLIEMYTLSEKAKEVLAKNKHVTYFSRMNLRDVSIYQYHDFIKRNHYHDPFEGLIKYLEEVSSKHITSNNWGLYRNTLYEISNVYSKEANISEALKYIILVCYLDINGAWNNFSLESARSLYKRNKDDYFKPYESNIDIIAPGALGKLSEYKTKLNLTDLELEEAINQVITLIDLPFQNFPKEKATKVILAELSNDIELLEEYYLGIEEYVVNNYF